MGMFLLGNCDDDIEHAGVDVDSIRVLLSW